MENCVEYIEGFRVIKGGECVEIIKGEKDFNALVLKIKQLFSSSRLMPAFGVSLHKETLNAMQEGDWLEIIFSNEQEKNGLKFSKLLFKLEITGGVNLIRFNQNKYEGRCLFLDFDDLIDLKQLLN